MEQEQTKAMPQKWPVPEIGVRNDRMAVTLNYNPETSDFAASLRFIEDALEDKGISLTQAEWTALKTALETARNEGGVLNAHVIKQGVPPETGRDGAIEWAGDFFNDGFVVDETTGAIDYRQRAARTTVENGQLLARILPPIPGTDGVDVFGNTIPAGEPRPALIRPATNVSLDEAGALHATRDGRIRFYDDELHVDDVYTVEGNVGLESGHIDHSGALVVHGSVEAESRIQARGDVEVHGHVESAEIITKGDLIIQGGLIGAPDIKLEVGGDVYARFMLNVTLEAGGCVGVQREMDRCTVRCRGAVDASRGRIIGGDVSALGGIVAGYVGSEATVRTRLTAGHDFALEDALRQKEQEMLPLEQTLAKIQATVEPLRPKVESMNPEARKAFAALVAQICEIKERISAIRRAMRDQEEDSAARARRRIRVNRIAYSGTTFSLGGEQLTLNDEVKGPLQAGLAEGGVTLVVPGRS